MESLRGLVPLDEMASLLATCAPPAYLTGHIDDLSPQVTERWIRRKIFLRAAESDATVVDRLRTLDPASFVYVCTKLERAIAAEFVRKTYDGCVDPDEREILLWCMGKQRHWAALLDISDKYDRVREGQLWLAARTRDFPGPAGQRLTQPNHGSVFRRTGARTDNARDQVQHHPIFVAAPYLWSMSPASKTSAPPACPQLVPRQRRLYY